MSVNVQYKNLTLANKLGLQDIQKQVWFYIGYMVEVDWRVPIKLRVTLKECPQAPAPFALNVSVV